jgi:NADPH2:quinone reductase
MSARVTTLTTVMKAIIYRRTGDSSVLELVDRPLSEPGDGEVRVRMAVSGVNPTDWKSRSGTMMLTPLAFPEVVPDQDGAGTVDAVGPGVSGLAHNDRVWIYLAAHERSTGTAQEYTVLPAERVVRLPAGASFDVGASLGVPAMTAHRALTVAEHGPSRLRPGALTGRTVLVAGGAGAVGHAAIQLARWAGAMVVTTVSSPAKVALASAAGAHHVLTYTDPGTAARIRELAPSGVDVIVEVAPSTNADLDQAVLATQGTIAVYAQDGDGTLAVDLGRHLELNARYQFLLLYTLDQAALAAAADDITAALEDGALPVGEAAGLPLLRFPLEQTADAHDAVEGGAVGKVLVDVSSA